MKIEILKRCDYDVLNYVLYTLSKKSNSRLDGMLTNKGVLRDAPSTTETMHHGVLDLVLVTLDRTAEYTVA